MNIKIFRSILLLVFLFYGVGDAITTFISHINGGIEMMIISRWIIDNYGIFSFVLVKIFITVFFIFLLLFFYNAGLKISTTGIAIIIFTFGLLNTINNIFVIFDYSVSLNWKQIYNILFILCLFSIIFDKNYRSNILAKLKT